MFGRNSASNSNASGSSSNPVPVLTLDNNREHEEEGGPITNYLSFGEHRSSNNDNNHNNNNNNPSSDPTHNVTHTPPRARHQQPVSLVASHEVLLQDQRNLHDNRYRGFSTSMHDMYIATEYERVDCCAMTCGGILQSDRDRFLLQGITPPSIARRFWVHVFFPVSIFALAAVGAMQIPDVTMNQWFTTASILLLLTYLILQCYKGRSKRIEIRKDLLWTKAQLQADRNVSLAVLLDQDPPDDFQQEQDYYLGQKQRDFGCAHPYCCLLGCYPEDRAAYELRTSGLFSFFQQRQSSDQNNNSPNHPTRQEMENQDQVARDTRLRHANLSRCLFDYACPAIWCGHQLQFCGICALAQEAREIEAAVLPAAYRRVDYISMQPVSHYFPAIYKRRHHDTLSSSSLRSRAGSGRWFQSGRRSQQGGLEDSALQQLADRGDSSNNISNNNNNSTGDRVPWIPLSNLSWQLIQFALTIIALVLIWSFVGRYFWRSALKLSVPEWRIFGWKDFLVFLAVWVQAILLTTVLSCFCNRPRSTNLSLDAMIKYFAAGFCLSTALAIVWELVLAVLARTLVNLLMAVAGIDVVVDSNGYSNSNNNGWMTLGADSLALHVAAKTESDSYLRAFGHKHPIFYTIYLAFCSFILAAFVEEACKYFGYRMVEHPDFMTQREIEEAMTVVIQQGDDDENDEEHNDEMDQRRREELCRRRQQQQMELEQMDFSKQKKSVQSLGGAISLAMLCVAMGFTCCENLVYIFVYSGSSLGMELSVLIARSLFPVHPIAAALQSIRVIERDVEVTRTATLGNILTPAVIFHGCFDFFILWIDFLSEKKNGGNYVQQGNNAADSISFVISAMVVGLAVVYYLISSSRQRARLQVMDASIVSGQSVLLS